MFRKRGALSGAQIAAAIGLSRQAAHRHLVRLLDAGRVETELGEPGEWPSVFPGRSARRAQPPRRGAVFTGNTGSMA